MEQLIIINMAILKTVVKETMLEVFQEINCRAANENENEKMLNAKEAAAYLSIKLSTLYEKTSGKQIPHVKQGNKVFFYLEELKQWRRKGRVKTMDELQDEAVTYAIREDKQSA
jgi:excisionase family DNA binding protein